MTFHSQITDRVKGGKGKTYLSVFLSQVVCSCTLGVVVSAVGLLMFPLPTDAAVKDWHQGVSIVSEYEEQLRSDEFKQSIRDLKETGATHAGLIIQLKQDRIESSSFYRYWRAPSDAVLRDSIDFIHSQGLEVVLKPHLDLPAGGPWRAYISPDDRDTWYQNYENMLVKYARIAQEKNVDGIILGTELVSVSSSYVNPDNEQRWRTMIAAVRGEYDGWLSYSGNWGGGDFGREAEHIAFWDALDYIGISAYYPLVGSTKDDYVASWDGRYRDNVRPIQQKNGNMPVLFTEIGYRSVEFANNQPWDGWGDTSQEKQAQLYEALFEYWDRHDSMKGVSLWNWKPRPDAGGEGNRDFTPQNKKAEQVMTEWWSGEGEPDPDPEPEPEPEPDASFAIDGTATDVELGHSSDISITIENTGDPVADAIVNLEIYNESGSKVHQEYRTDQSFSDNQRREYQFSWQPPTAGEYTVKAAVFSSSWALYTWKDHVDSISVSEEQGDPDFALSGSASPDMVATGESVLLRMTAVNSGDVVENVIVDVEVYDESGRRVFQEYRTDQSFGENDTREYTITWQPEGAGEYRVKAGVFTGDWSLYIWNNHVADISVTGDGELPSEIDVVFPGENGQVMGDIETFKARLADVSPSRYLMYWRVGSGQLVEMTDTDDGHKVALVSFTNWNWKSDGQYIITFVAKDVDGSTVAEQSVNIRVE